MKEKSVAKVEHDPEDHLDVPSDIIPDHPPYKLDGMTAGYTRFEIEAARETADEVVRLTKEVGNSLYELARVANEFCEKRHYQVLGFKSFDQFYAAHGYAPSTIRQYIKVYRELTLSRGVELDRYKSLDIGKIDGLRNLITAGADDVQLDECLRLAERVDVPDWRALSEQATANIKAGRELWADVPDSQTPIEPRDSDSLEPGHYVLRPLTGKELGKADPALNGGLKKIKGLRRKFYVDQSDGECYMEIM